MNCMETSHQIFSYACCTLSIIIWIIHCRRQFPLSLPCSSLWSVTCQLNQLAVNLIGCWLMSDWALLGCRQRLHYLIRDEQYNRHALFHSFVTSLGLAKCLCDPRTSAQHLFSCNDVFFSLKFTCIKCSHWTYSIKKLIFFSYRIKIVQL